MSGIYGNSSEDRHFERMCDNYTDKHYGEDLCGCNKTHTDEQRMCGTYEVDKEVYELGDTDEDGYYTCGNCEYIFEFKDIKIK